MKLRKYIAVLTVCLLLCGMAPMSVSSAADLHPLKNGGFESGTTEAWDAHSGVSVSADAAYEGEYGCLLTGDGDWDDLLSQTFSVLPGYTYSLRFWYKAEKTGISWYLLDGDDRVRLCRGWADNTAWTLVEKAFTPSSDTVTLLYRGSGSFLDERVYLDGADVTLLPCAVHTYDNDCDTVCNICDQVRTVGDHVYDHDCDIFCNNCGFERPPSGKHTYDFPCATLCNYCGAPRVGEGEHTYDDVCDTVCNYCEEVREVPHFYDFPCAPSCSRCGDIRENISEDLHTYDDIYDADCNNCDHVRIPAPKPMERLSFGGASLLEFLDTAGDEAKTDLTFLFTLEAQHAQTKPNWVYISRSATVCRYNNGVEYKLIRMGTIISNAPNPVLDLEHVDDSKTINVKGTNLWNVTDTSISFTALIRNIPERGWNQTISARPYYVYSDGKEQIVVYGETVITTTVNSVRDKME